MPARMAPAESDRATTRPVAARRAPTICSSSEESCHAPIPALRCRRCPGASLPVGISDRAARRPHKPVRIKLATAAPKDTSYHRILREMGEKWRKVTTARSSCVIYPGGNQGSEADAVRRMNIGELQAAMLTAGGLTEIDPAVSALEGNPDALPVAGRGRVRPRQAAARISNDGCSRRDCAAVLDRHRVDAALLAQGCGNPRRFQVARIFVTASGSEKQMRIMQALGYRRCRSISPTRCMQLQNGGVDAVPTHPDRGARRAVLHRRQAHDRGELDAGRRRGGRHATGVGCRPQASRTRCCRRLPKPGAAIQEQSRLENEQAVATMKAKWGVGRAPGADGASNQQWRSFAESVYPKIRGSMVPADMFDRARQLVGRNTARRANDAAGSSRTSGGAAVTGTCGREPRRIHRAHRDGCRCPSPRSCYAPPGDRASRRRR